MTWFDDKRKQNFKINNGFLNFGQLSLKAIGCHNKIIKITHNYLNKEMKLSFSSV